jgi:hypothetical protein
MKKKENIISRLIKIELQNQWGASYSHIVDSTFNENKNKNLDQKISDILDKIHMADNLDYFETEELKSVLIEIKLKIEKLLKSK